MGAFREYTGKQMCNRNPTMLIIAELKRIVKWESYEKLDFLEITLNNTNP
jgi:hypothetical protein